MKITLLLATCLLAIQFAPFALASDIVSSVRDGRGSDSEDYKTFELGVAGGYFDNPYIATQGIINDWFINVDVSGEITYKNFFFEASQGSQDGLNLGYNIWSNEGWSVDFLAASMIGWLSDISIGSDEEDDEPSRNERLEERETFYLGTGVRVTRYIQDYVVQYRLVTDTYKNNGAVSTIRVGRGWQIKNWHFSAILSGQYTSKRTSNYWLGIDADEATTRYPEFEASDGTSYSLVFNATKPLSEKWVFRAYLGYAPVSSGGMDSPLIEGDSLRVALLSINYVFF